MNQAEALHLHPWAWEVYVVDVERTYQLLLALCKYDSVLRRCTMWTLCRDVSGVDAVVDDIPLHSTSFRLLRTSSSPRPPTTPDRTEP